MSVKGHFFGHLKLGFTFSPISMLNYYKVQRRFILFILVTQWAEQAPLPPLKSQILLVTGISINFVGIATYFADIPVSLCRSHKGIRTKRTAS